MQKWVSELRSLIRSWMDASPDRNVSVLYRMVSKMQDISYGTVKHAAKGDHEINLWSAMAILKVVIPTKDGRKSFIERHHPEYVEFAREFFEDHEKKGKAPEVSKIEAHVLAKLIKKGSVNLEAAKTMLGDQLYSNLLAWLNYHNVGKEQDDYLILNGPQIDVDNFHAAKQMISAAIDEMDATKYDGDLIKVALGTTSREAARECWYIQEETWRRCHEIIKNNPGDHEILTANIMKFN
ncbi:MAG TPA: hypothetical protein VFO10_30000 [Oligoflexus sp.]|uniref:hypothetical protein n=1 Tax=Oligoflexus sp. TaxID=1971216 RepID=UPI002D803605|nr:hypothetical protein [Oligoflexus sp.]HET9241537.1 hypothetical protein [Oligoflexus sp.]